MEIMGTGRKSPFTGLQHE